MNFSCSYSKKAQVAHPSVHVMPLRSQQIRTEVFRLERKNAGAVKSQADLNQNRHIRLSRTICSLTEARIFGLGLKLGRRGKDAIFAN